MIVAIVGNAAEHGGAVVVAYRGKIKLAAEIALASSAQVAVFLSRPSPCCRGCSTRSRSRFRPVEIGVLAISVAITAALLFDGRSSPLEGAVLVAAYVGAAAAFFVAGDR